MKLILFITLALFSCSSQNEKKEVSMTFLRNDIEVDLSSVTISPMFASFTVVNVDDKLYHLFIYNERQLIITDLNNFRLEKIIPLKRGEGPDEINTIPRKAYMISEDRYLIESFRFCYVVDGKGYVKHRVSLDDLLKDELKKGKVEFIDNLRVGGTKGSSVQVGNGEYLMTVLRKNYFIGEDYPYFPMFATLSLSESEEINIKVLPVTFPEDLIYDKGLSYGASEVPNYTVSGDWLVYNFYFSSNIYLYNLMTGEKRKIKAEVEDGNNHQLPIADKTIPIRRYLSIFSNVLYDSQNEIVYRNHITINEEDPALSRNYMTAYTLQGEKLCEYYLGTNKEVNYLRNPFYHDGSIFMNPFYPSSDEKLDLVRLTLVDEK
ncbi:DUF4221 domain-containing protein [Echinicola marina]|uniref:DUF4221 domain-containing protein n=1 Tax=Echinicola marina TaxID=2859768 RepID=UPI001CF6A11A|nr:DUF4221 domain-containing protein [Echinicola marina]UCS93964.1 DUF4221 domain-containing protein [Echinicola marina]